MIKTVGNNGQETIHGLKAYGITLTWNPFQLYFEVKLNLIPPQTVEDSVGFPLSNSYLPFGNKTSYTQFGSSLRLWD